MTRQYQKYDAASHDYDIQCHQPSVPSGASPSLVCAIQQSGKAEDGKKNPPWWYVLIAWPDGITAWAVLLTLAAIVWQAVQTKKAAQAALLNAQAVLNSERPWILMETKVFHNPGQEPVSMVVAKNCGRTPARSTRLSEIKIYIVPKGASLPAKPDHGKIAPQTTPIILVRDETASMTFVSETIVKNQCTVEGSWERVLAGEDTVYIVGVVFYDDLLNSGESASHETGWCCTYWPEMPLQNRLILHGPEGYNYHT